MKPRSTTADVESACAQRGCLVATYASVDAALAEITPDLHALRPTGTLSARY